MIFITSLFHTHSAKEHIIKQFVEITMFELYVWLYMYDALHVTHVKCNK